MKGKMMRAMTRALAASFTIALLAAPDALADTPPSEMSGNTPADDAFVNAMTSAGINRERGALIATAHFICDNAKNGPGLIPTPLQVMSALHVLPGQADFVVNQAQSTICPGS